MNEIDSINSKCILLVEDDTELANMISAFLRDEGFDVEWTDNGTIAVEKILHDVPDLVVLDVMLPELDGIEVCQRVKDDFVNPILMLTAKEDEFTEITSLNRGAVGYLTKPVRAHVLLAHIKALLRRHQSVDKEMVDGAIVIQDLVVKTGAYEATLNGEQLDLTTAEFQLLSILAKHAGQIISRDSLYLQLRGIEYDGIDRSIDMRVSSLREKMKDATPPYRYIKTIRGKGYLLARN